MNVTVFSLAVPADNRLSLARAWLLLGVLSLLIANAATLLFASERFFPSALVLHVDFSVLSWFIAFGGVMWSLGLGPRLISIGWLALTIGGTGMTLMALAPFVAQGDALFNNYAPVLQQPIFLFGLGLLGLGGAVLVLRSLIAAFPQNQRGSGAVILHFGLMAAAVTAAIAVMAFAWSYLGLPSALTGRSYYEALFWGGGHVLQFTYTLLMLVAWLWIASASGVVVALPTRVVFFLLIVGLVPVLAVPLAYLAFEVASAQHLSFFALFRQYAGSLAAIPLAVVLLYGLWRAPPGTANARALRAALFSSIALFSASGIIGLLIQGDSGAVPTHHHGSIAAVTLAFMGLTYYLLPKLGYVEPDPKWALAQPLLYGGGQLLYILGLAWSGGYGVQYKAGVGLMNAGGVIAIVGSLIFIVIFFRAIYRARLDRRTRERVA